MLTLKLYRYPRTYPNQPTRYCYGVQFWRSKRTTMEFWYIPRGVSLPIHRHPNQHINLIPIVMDDTCKFNRRHVSSLNIESVKGKLFKAYTTPDGYYHWFSERTAGILFLNHTRWLNGVMPTSPSKNYITLEDDLYGNKL